jgi:GT2 family glycosyltransferase
MFWRRSRFGEKRLKVGDAEETPQPVKILHVEVGELKRSPDLHILSGDRLWIEVTKNGQVVGVIDAVAEDGDIPAKVLKKLGTDFNDSETTALARLADDELPRVSVVVPTLCREPLELIRNVESLLDLDYPDFDVIVVDNRAARAISPIPALPDDPRLRVFAERTPGVSAARNLGIVMSTADVVAFTDDDAIVASNWLRVIGTRFALDPEIEAIGGLVLPLELEWAPQLWFEEFYGGFSPSFRFEKLSVKRMKNVDPMFPYAIGRFGAGCNMAYRRSTLEKLGNFNPCLGGGTLAKGGEDVLVAVNLVVKGGTFAYEPAALVRHRHRRTESAFLEQVFNYGVGLTALYTALIVEDPRHLLALARRVGVGLSHLLRSPPDRSSSTEPSYPRRTLIYQVAGMAYGPVAYGRSVLRHRRRA